MVKILPIPTHAHQLTTVQNGKQDQSQTTLSRIQILQAFTKVLVFSPAGKRYILLLKMGMNMFYNFLLPKTRMKLLIFWK